MEGRAHIPRSVQQPLPSSSPLSSSLPPHLERHVLLARVGQVGEGPVAEVVRRPGVRVGLQQRGGKE